MAKKKNASSSKKGSADDGAPDSADAGASPDSADDGASPSAAMGGASESAELSGASFVDKRAAMASALDFGADAGSTMTCSKLIMKNAEKMSRPEQYPSWAPAFLTLLSISCVQGWAIATGKATPTHSFEPKTGKVTKVGNKAEHKKAVYDPNNRLLYMLIITFLSGKKMRTIVKQSIPNDGYALWQTLKARMEQGGAVRKRKLLQDFYKSTMVPTQTIVEWTDQLGEMRVTLADQFNVSIADSEICGHALQGIKAMYRSVRNSMYTEADSPGVIWEDFLVKLHRACDVVDLDAKADAEAYAADSAIETREQLIRRRNARIRKLEAEIKKLRLGNASAEESVADAEEESNDVAEESSDRKPADAGMAFSF